VDAQRGFEQERRKDDVENEVMRQHRSRFEPRHGKTDAGKNEPHCVGQTHAPGDDRDEYRHDEEANGVRENVVHQIGCGAIGKAARLSLEPDIRLAAPTIGMIPGA